MLVGLATAQAADTTLTLACQGTVTTRDTSPLAAEGDPKPEPYSMGVTVNLTADTVQGFGMEYPVKITHINAGTIIFSHSEKQWDLQGQIDRVTGDMQAMITNWLDVQRRNTSNEQFYNMKCRPAQRMF
jgi:hypothetical protein